MRTITSLIAFREKKADEAFETVLLVCIRLGTPELKLPRFSPPIPFVTILSPVPVEVVILFPLIEYELGAAFVITYGESIEI